MNLRQECWIGVLALAVCCCWLAPPAQAQLPGPDDHFISSTTAVFKFTASSTYGGGTYVIWARGPTCIVESSSHLQTAVGTSGVLGDATTCGYAGSQTQGTSDAEIGVFPPGFNSNGGYDELHTEIVHMNLTGGGGFSIIAGSGYTTSGLRSLGEIESRVPNPGGFPADSFFNIYLEVQVPPIAGGPMTLHNVTPMTVVVKNILALPPWGAQYLHSFKIMGKVPLFDINGCFAGWLEQGTHGLGTQTPGLHHLKLDFPVVFSVHVGAEGLLQPDPCHPPPNDVFSLGTAGGHGYATQGELFQASGAILGGRPDNTNVDRISASLGISNVGPGMPPFMGPFAPPPPAAPPPFPAPPGTATNGTLGLQPGDNINAVSFGMDGGDTLLFSVDDSAVGAAGTAVNFHAVVSPLTGVCVNGAGGNPSNGVGGDPGDEAAGDIFISAPFWAWGGGPPLPGLGAAPWNSNLLGYDDLQLGLQAPAVQCSATTDGIEDDLDALEATTADVPDSNRNGQIDPGEGYVFFSLDPGSATVTSGLAFTEDILVSVQGGGFTVYAAGATMGLQAGDDIDALALYDQTPPFGGPNGILDVGFDTALFSLAAGSPSLAAWGATPGFVFLTTFNGMNPLIYANPGQLGLTATDELNALDIGWAFPCYEATGQEWYVDSDGDGIPDPCDNCPHKANSVDSEYNEQTDSDGDGSGDWCDNCPVDYNPGQEDSDGDGTGDACENPDACQHSITMWDDYGDGWNGGYIDVYVGGDLVLAGVTLATGSGPETVYFDAATDDDITTVWTAGGYPYEASYCIYDDVDQELGCDGTGGDEPVGITVVGYCSPIEACCGTNGVCTDELPEDCTTHGGTPQGPGTACSAATIACCLPDGTCLNTDPLCCDDEGGWPSIIGEPACLGDTDLNGVDDACETWTPGLEVGINIDVHQDTDLGTHGANDFHIEGRIESGEPGQNWADPPKLLDHVDDLFPNFTHSITPDMTDPNQNWYNFTADWSGHEYMYCEVLHAGLLFEVSCHNVVIDLVGWWTRDGVRVGIPSRGNEGYWPILGFDVQDQEEPQRMRIQNGNMNFINDPGEIELWVVDMGLAAFADKQELVDALGGNPNPFRELYLDGEQQNVTWTPVYAGTEAISELNPVWMQPDSFFDVILQGGGMYRPEVDMVVPPGGYLIARERIHFYGTERQEEWRWLWELHEAHGPEVGDAPDSSNSWGPAMTAYPAGGPPGVFADFPSVYVAGSPPHGPIHWAPRAAAWLGPWVSLETEADLLPDEDGVTNIDPVTDTPDQDMADDGVTPPLALPHCQWTSFGFSVTTGPAPVDPMYVNVWADWTRDGDWDDQWLCTFPVVGIADEWAVHDMVLSGLMPNMTYSFTTPQFLPWHPTDPPEELWLRITLSEQPWPWASPPGQGYGGAGPAGGYQFGETEDYYLFAEGCEIELMDSCMMHDAPCDQMCLPIGCDGGLAPYDNVEPRLQLGVPPTLVLDLGPCTCDPGEASVTVTCNPNPFMGNATVNCDGSSSATVTFDTTLPDQSCCDLAFTGDIDDVRTIVMLEGDVDRDCFVTTADDASITGRLGWQVQVVGCQYDVDRDCFITTADGSSIIGRLGNLAPCPCPCP